MLKKIEYILSTEFDAWGVARIEPIDEEIARLKSIIAQNENNVRVAVLEEKNKAKDIIPLSSNKLKYIITIFEDCFT